MIFIISYCTLPFPLVISPGFSLSECNKHNDLLVLIFLATMWLLRQLCSLSFTLVLSGDTSLVHNSLDELYKPREEAEMWENDPNESVPVIDLESNLDDLKSPDDGVDTEDDSIVSQFTFLFCIEREMKILLKWKKVLLRVPFFKTMSV